MYTFKKLTEISWPVTIREPLDGGKFEDHEVTIRFKRYTDSEKEALLKSTGTIEELLKTVVTGWGSNDFIREDKTEITFSAETLSELLNVEHICRAIHQGFYRANAGVLEKN